MMSVAAAALIAGTGFASAQGTGPGRDAPSAGSTAQQSAPSSEKAAPAATPMNRDAAEPAKPGTKSTQSDQKMQPNAAKNAQGDMKAGPKGEKSAQDTNLKGEKSAQDSNLKGEKSAQDNNLKGEKSKSMSSETSGPAGKDMKAEGRNGNMNAESKGAADKNLNADSKGAADSKATTTTGQAGAGAKLSTEQRTKITTVIKGEHVQPLANVNFSISVGSRVPRTVSFHPLPAEVVTYYPEWRGYEFILVGDQIVVINPRTLEIVAVIEA
jgi:hypothetical protein